MGARAQMAPRASRRRPLIWQMHEKFVRYFRVAGGYRGGYTVMYTVPLPLYTKSARQLHKHMNYYTAV